MSHRLKKILLLLLAAALLASVSFVQKSLNDDRERLGLTHAEPLENAPPVLAFTTVALGGFRGLISNALWIRMADLQDNDKFFEMQQLADWITKLEPRFAQVWVNQAWNMSYNISVKFKDAADRWRWVKAGIELLRDQGLKYNPNEPLIYRELAWHFQHKMGANLDDANVHYKREWAREMTAVFGGDKPNFDELINPQTDDARKRALILTNQYKMDPAFMKELDDRFGLLEWRLPEAHAIYWAEVGLKKARANPIKIDRNELTQLRRVVFQSMQTSFYRGRLARNPRIFDFRPNLNIFPKVNETYEEMIRDEPDPNQQSGIRTAQRNIIKDAIYFLYVQNRKADAARWYQVLAEKFPNGTLVEGDPNSFPRNLTLRDYAVARVQEEINETSRDRMRAVIEGLILNAYENLILGNDEDFEVYLDLVQAAWNNYDRQIGNTGKERVSLPPIREIAKEILDRMLNPETGLPPELRAELRTRLQMPAETAPAPAAGTNAPPASTNAPAAGTNR